MRSGQTGRSLKLRKRSGLTLIEVLIGLVMTLVVLVAMMRAFRYASTEIARGRAMIEMANQLRLVQENLRTELEGVTVDTRPWAVTASPNGYFEYVEGTARFDGSSVATTENAFGDFDDLLAFTTRSDGNPYAGRYGGGMEQSYVAEAIYYCDYDDRDNDATLDQDEIIKLYRRVLLIRPDLPSVPATTAAAVRDYLVMNDLSVRWVDTDNDGNRDTLVPNSLEDLARRENRFGHLDLTTTATGVYPHILNRVTVQNLQLSETNLFAAGGNAALQFEGLDIALADVTGFDIKIYSPNTDVGQTDGIVLLPADIPVQYTAATAVDQGAYVDLAYGLIYGTGGTFDPTVAAFSTVPTAQSQIPPVGSTDVAYDSFTKFYEANGIDDDGDGLVDEGMDGLDNDAANGVDDNFERETMPPYPFRLQGLKVSIRVIERVTQQIRQTSIHASFLPN